LKAGDFDRQRRVIPHPPRQGLGAISMCQCLSQQTLPPYPELVLAGFSMPGERPAAKNGTRISRLQHLTILGIQGSSFP
jgi:hypothetical protein